MITAETHEQLGGLLRQAREAKRKDISRIATKLHIRPRYLEALEDGTLEHLPGPAYTLGYLRRYAAYLEVDVEAIVAAHQRIGAPPPPKFFHLPDALRRDEHPPRTLSLVGALAAVILFVLWGGSPPPFPPALEFSTHHTPRPAPIECLRAEPDNWPPCYWRASWPQARWLSRPHDQRPLRTLAYAYLQ